MESTPFAYSFALYQYCPLNTLTPPLARTILSRIVAVRVFSMS